MNEKKIHWCHQRKGSVSKFSKNLVIRTRAFCDGTSRYGVLGNENKECIFCMLVLQYHIINHGVPAPSGTFSSETVRMYKNPGNQKIFPKNSVERNFCLVYND